MKYKITYGKSVHDIKEINAVIEVLKSSTAMGKRNKIRKKLQNNLLKNIVLWSILEQVL